PHTCKIFELMRKDVNEIVDTFRELNEMRIKGIKKIPPFLSVKKTASSGKNEFLHRFRALWKSEEYQLFLIQNILILYTRFIS
ncbi:unnamed protein product, partial [marine sediment metagenome]